MVAVFRAFLLGLFGLVGASSASAQVWTYPFTDGTANLPAFSLSTGDSVRMHYTLVNPVSKPVWVMLSVFVDEMEASRLYTTKSVLIGRAGQLMSMAQGQRSQFADAERYDINTIRIQLPAKSRIHVSVLYHKRANEGIRQHQPQLFTKPAYRAFLNQFYVNDRPFQMQSALFWGLLLMMLLYTLVQYHMLRQRVLLYYFLYLGCILARSLSAVGYFALIERWLILRQIGFVGSFSLTFVFWSIGAYALFIREFANLPQRSIAFDSVLKWASWIFFGLGIGDIFLTVDRLVVPFWRFTYQALTIGMIGFGIYSVYVLWRTYDPVVRYIFWGVVCFILMGAASQLNQWLNSADPFTVFQLEASIYTLGYVLEILAFSSGLAKRQQLVLAERLALQEQIIVQLQENQRKQDQLQQIRGEIARDLHDELGSELSGISILSQVAEKQLVLQPAQAQTALTAIGETARYVMERMRDIVWSLSLNQLQTDALAGRFQDLTMSLLEHTGIRSILEIAPDLLMSALLPDQWRNLSLIYKEALYNVVKHARATQVRIRLTLEDHILCLTICDDGIGFKPNNSLIGNGLKNQYHRASALGGQLQIDSELGIGTKLTLHFPVHTFQLMGQSEISAPSLIVSTSDVGQRFGDGMDV
jgi:signal transduction histidine kinase